jgi:acetyltransferase-like isoleucine patch superfamily enzyme
MKLRDELTERLIVSDDDRIKVGRYSYGKPKVYIWHGTESVEIGSFCSLSDDVIIFAGGEHNPNWVTTYPLRFAFHEELAGLDGHPTTKGPVNIGNDVWIGYRVIIVSGVTIGDGSVIGSGSVVSQNIPPYSVATGNPARVIKKRFNDYQIQALLDIKWWDWPIEEIKESSQILCSEDIDKFIEYARLKGIDR